MNRSKLITDGALLTAIYIVLLLIAVFVPVIALVTTFLLPIPFIVFAYRYNWKPSLLMFVAASVFTSLFATIFSIPMTVLMGIGGIVIGSAMYKKIPPYETLLRGTFGFIIGILIVFLLSQILFNINLIEEADQTTDQYLEMMMDIAKQTGLSDQMGEQLELVEQQMEMIKNLLPVGIVLVALLMTFISQWLGYKLINRIDKKKFTFPPFRNVRFPVSIVWIYFFALMLTLFDLDTSSVFYHAINNVLALAGMLMTIQGFSFIFFYAHMKNKSKAFPIGIVIVTLLIPSLLLYLVRILGIIDIGFRLRDRLTEGKK